MRKATLTLLMGTFPLFAPLIPPAPKVIDTRESIRGYVGFLSRINPICQSNIMVGILQVESETRHRYMKGPRKGKIKISYKGAIGVSQVMPIHTRKGEVARGLDLNKLNQNIQASFKVFEDHFIYYRKSYGERQATLRAVQSYWGGHNGRISKRELARRYMHHVLHHAENHTIPYKYR